MSYYQHRSKNGKAGVAAFSFLCRYQLFNKFKKYTCILLT